MKKKIIVPVDFSTASQNAYSYAKGLAQDSNDSIELLYVYVDSLGENQNQVEGEIKT
jgi:hypothetical protein